MPPDINPPQPRPASPVDAARKHRPAPRVKLRRTIVPILCTLALLLPSLAIWLGRVDIDSPFATLPTWVRPALIATGVAAGALAVVNMLQLRAMLRR